MKTLKKKNFAHPNQTEGDLKKVRNRQIYSMRINGFTLNQIADYFQLSVTQIRYILQGFPKYSSGVGGNENKGLKQSLNMTPLELTFNESPDVEPTVKPIAVEVTTNNFFSNRLTGGNN